MVLQQLVITLMLIESSKLHPETMNVNNVETRGNKKNVISLSVLHTIFQVNFVVVDINISSLQASIKRGMSAIL